MPTRGDRVQSVLAVVEGLSRGREEAPQRRHGARSDEWRGQVSALGEPGAQRGRRGDDAQESGAQKKSDGSWRGGRFVRRCGAEKMEMIRLVEQSDLPVRSTLRQLGIAPSTFYGW